MSFLKITGVCLKGWNFRGSSWTHGLRRTVSKRHAALVGILTQAFWTVNDFRLVQRRKSSQEIPMIMRTKKTPRIIDVWTQCLFLDHSKYLPWLKWSFWEPAKAQIWQISSPQAGVVSVLRSSGGSNVSLHWCYLLYTMLQTIWPTVFFSFHMAFWLQRHVWLSLLSWVTFFSRTCWQLRITPQASAKSLALKVVASAFPCGGCLVL